MIRKEYPELDEVTYQTRLPNGLRICVIPKPGFARKYALLAANYGSVDTRFCLDGQWHQTPDGVAHYLEHKMFDLPGEDVMQQFTLLGANPNAFTDCDMTAYHFDCTDNFAQSLSLLLRMVFTPYFTSESVERERGIIEQEIKMYEDSADTQASETLYAALLEHHPMRIPVAGTVESIQAITADMLYDCHRAFYDPSNMLLCVAGDVDPQQVADIAAEYSPASCVTIGQRDYGPAEILDRKPVIVRSRMEIAMPTFQLSFRTRPLTPGEDRMKRDFVADMAADLLVGEGSALYARLYETNLIDSAFGVGYESVRDLGILNMGGDSPEPEQVMEEILKEARHLGRSGFDPVAFERLRKSSIGCRIRGLDQLETLCYRMAAWIFDDLDYLLFPSVSYAIEPDEVLEFMKDTVREERMALSIIEPNEGR